MESYPDRARAALEAARLMLIFTPDELQEGSREARLRAALPLVDVLQVRTKRPGEKRGPSPARPLLEWTELALDLAAGLPTDRRPLILVDDRVDVLAALGHRELAGVHLGDRDCPAERARGVVGADPIIGWSTHSLADVEAAHRLPVDYLGFGPVAATRTKGLTHGLGCAHAREAIGAASLPVFAIGGITPSLARELGTEARVAVGAAILDAPDVEQAANEFREALASA